MKLKRLLALLLSILLLLGLTACGGSSESYKSEAMDAGGSYNEAPAEMENGMISDSQSPAAPALPENRKLIRTVRMDAETEELNTLLTALDEKIAGLGGYVEGREVYNGSMYSGHRYRRANLTIRIPADKLDGFVEHVEGVSNVVSSNESVDDVTTQYVDTESRVNALKIEQERLMELLAKAETMEEILVIEERLTAVRYELENYASQLKVLDNQVSYATVYLEISEVQEYTPVAEETVWQRIAGGFMDSLEGLTEGFVDFFVWVMANSPYLLVWGVVLFVLVKLLRKVRLPRKARKAAAEDEPKATE